MLRWRLFATAGLADARSLTMSKIGPSPTVRFATSSPDTGEGFRSAFVAGDGDPLADGFEDAFGVGEDVVVPEAKDAVAVGFDEAGAGRVRFAVVLAAV